MAERGARQPREKCSGFVLVGFEKAIQTISLNDPPASALSSVRELASNSQFRQTAPRDL